MRGTFAIFRKMTHINNDTNRKLSTSSISYGYSYIYVEKSPKRGTFDSAKNHKRQRRKRQSVTAKREKSQTPKFV